MKRTYYAWYINSKAITSVLNHPMLRKEAAQDLADFWKDAYSFVIKSGITEVVS